MDLGTAVETLIAAIILLELGKISPPKSILGDVCAIVGAVLLIASAVFAGRDLPIDLWAAAGIFTAGFILFRLAKVIPVKNLLGDACHIIGILLLIAGAVNLGSALFGSAPLPQP